MTVLWNPQLRPEGFSWAVLLPVYPCWWQLAHSGKWQDTRILLRCYLYCLCTIRNALIKNTLLQVLKLNIMILHYLQLHTCYWKAKNPETGLSWCVYFDHCVQISNGVRYHCLSVFSGTFPWIYPRLCQIQRSTRLNIQISWVRKLSNSLPKYQVSKKNQIAISKTLEYFLYTSFLCFLPDFINKCLLFIDVFKLKFKFNYWSKIFTDGCLSYHPTNNVKGLKDHYDYYSAT